MLIWKIPIQICCYTLLSKGSVQLVMVLGKSVLDLPVIWNSQLQRNWTNLFELGMHLGRTLEKSIFFLLSCACDMPKETSLV